ncbi:MAG: glycoside hydrolase family 127 protein [Clostridia bacterium]|nr:glycoside hydrolase family 127 protein [Clostridia bacterium]
MVDCLYSYPAAGTVKYSGKADDAVHFMLTHQLLDTAMWQKFVNVFRSDSDDEDNGWRCEYWGKTMRGGCLTYRYTGDPTLYEALQAAVDALLRTQRKNGCFSTYPDESPYRGWDLWGRKYVLTGLQHFYGICKDETRRQRILAAMTAHAKCLFRDIGKDKVDITLTSDYWGGVNSCSILEPIVELYKLTRDPRCLDFADYILSTGGCKDGDLLALAAENARMPYEYPEVKAYETMSFFEGVLAMYEATGKRSYLDTVEKFAAAVRRTDITAIGCAGCTHELFDHSAKKQTFFSDGIMQETCVTVTWMRLNARLFLLTGKECYFAQVEHSAYNALFGAVNTHMLPFSDLRGDKLFPALPFDSYSPLVNQRRGRGIGGLKHFSDGSFYGCCACIASAGTALLPLLALLQSADGAVFNSYLKGAAVLSTPAGNELKLRIETDYPANAKTVIRVRTAAPERFVLKLRMPAFIKNPTVLVNGAAVTTAPENGYLTLDRSWHDDTVTLTGDLTLEKSVLNGMTSFSFGTLTLARDAQKEPAAVLSEPLLLKKKPAQRVKPETEETVRFLLDRADGGQIVLTDYASCGKRWDKQNSAVSVWFACSETK